MEAMLGGLIGFVLGILADRINANWSRITGRTPVDIVIESDPAVFLAGEPNWDAFEYLFPNKSIDDIQNPPTHICREWHRWALQSGGISANEQRIHVTVVPRDETTILVEALEPKILSRKPVTEGSYVTCPVGGAEGMLRHIEIDLREEPPFTYFRDDGGETTKPFKFTLTKGDAERFEIVAKADPRSVIEWRAQLHIITNGRRTTLTLDDRGRPFVVAGTQAAKHFVWEQRYWVEIG